MHILMISRGLPEERYPLNGVFEFDQAMALEKIGVHVTLFSVDLRSLRRKRKWGIQREQRNGVDCCSISIPVGAVPLDLQIRIGTWALKKLYRNTFQGKKPDLIHAHFTKTACMAANLSEEEGIPLVVTEHSSEMAKTEINEQILRTAQYAYSRASRVIAVGRFLAGNIRKKTGIACTVIPNIMGDKAFFEVNRRKKDDGFGFVFCGSLIPRKRPLLLLNAFRQLAENDPGIRLGIIGDGELHDELEKCLHEWKLDDRVTLFGQLPRKEIAAIYGDYDCFVLPSAGETFGVVYIEALAAGLPVIATACGGPEEFVSRDVGVVVPVDDQDSLVNAMRWMTENRGRYNGDCLRDYVRSRYSPDVVASAIKDVYTSILTQ